MLLSDKLSNMQIQTLEEKLKRIDDDIAKSRPGEEGKFKVKAKS